MKKYSLIIMIACLIAAGCKKEEKTDDPVNNTPAPPEQWGWTFEYTRTNCSTCGSKGGPLIHQLHGLGKVVAIAGHCSNGGDPMENSLINGFYIDRPSGGGIPSFWVGNAKVGFNGTEAVDTMNALKTRKPCAGVELSYSISGNIMTVKSKTRFVSAQTGEFKISIFILEDGIDGGDSSGAYNQAGASNYIHDFVLRDALASTAYGEVLTSNPTKDLVLEKTYTFTLQTGWVKNNCYPVAMIWKYDGNANPKHQYINAFENKN